MGGKGSHAQTMVPMATCTNDWKRGLKKGSKRGTNGKVAGYFGVRVLRSLGTNDSSSTLIPVLEVLVQHPVGESFTADTDTFQHTVASQLMHHKMGVNETRGLDLVRDDASDKGRIRGSQCGHQVVQLLLHNELKNKLPCNLG